MEENEISRIVIGEAIKVHRLLGPGLLENVYKECLAEALTNVGLKVEKEKSIPVVFQGKKLMCGYRIDLFVEDKLVIEIKSVDQLSEIHLAQVLTYLRLGEYKLGLLMNFNVLLLKEGCRRVINGNLSNTTERYRSSTSKS
jgi:GxxExxY protein